VVPDLPFDFAFSFIVFQHIPSHQIVENYVREVHRLLRPGGLFKFQVMGGGAAPPKARFPFHLRSNQPDPNDTWQGAKFSEEAVLEMAKRCRFECRHRVGAQEQYFWLWFFKGE
jgi:SAM-dependent methyltransferase